jgi:hypothetical protein
LNVEEKVPAVSVVWQHTARPTGAYKEKESEDEERSNIYCPTKVIRAIQMKENEINEPRSTRG